MTKINLNKDLQLLGLNKKDFSIKLSNPYAYYHIGLGIGLVWEVYCRNERDGTHLYKKEFKEEEDAKKYMIDLVRVKMGKKTIYNVISTQEQFNHEKKILLDEINNQLSKSRNKEKFTELKKMLLEFKINSTGSTKDKIEEYLLENSFLIGEDIFHKIFFFINSIH